MKVKNIMFSGFAAAILMGVAAEASAAPVAVASKGYVDSVAGQLGSLTTSNKANLVVAINELDGEVANKLNPVGQMMDSLGEGKYYSVISQATDGSISVTQADLARTITAGNMIAPTTDAVATAIQGVTGQTTNLNLDQTGGAGKYVQWVKQENGQVRAEAGTIDEAMNAESDNPVTNAAITAALDDKQDTLELGTNLSYGPDGKLNAKDTTYTGTGYINIDANNVITATGLQKTLIPGDFVEIDDEGNITTTYSEGDNITIDEDGKISTTFPEMPAGCSGEGVTCVLTNEAGVFKWAVLTPTTNDQSWTLPTGSVVPEVTQ